VRLWDLAARPARAVAVLRGHRDTVFDLAVSPDGAQVASVDRDGMLRVWNVATGTSRVLAGHEGPAKRVAFSPDGAAIATGGDDGTLRLWPARVPELPADARGLADWLAAATSVEIVAGDRARTPQK
jgi:WD40 repeat protein